MFSLKHFIKNALSTSLSSVYSYFTYMIGLTKRSHFAPKMQHITFCDSIVRFDWCRTKRIESVCEVTWIPLCAKDGYVITWGRGEGETLSLMLCRLKSAEGLKARTQYQQFIRNTARGAGQQLTIAANHHHHHEGAPLTVALMSGKRHFGLKCCARHWQDCQIHGKLFLFRSN